MTDNNYSIQPLVKEDLLDLANHVQESKLPLTINRLLFKKWPNHDAQRTNYTKAILANADDPAVARFKVVETATGRMVAHLVLMQKHKKSNVEQDAGARTGNKAPTAPKSMNAEVFQAVVQACARLAVDDVDHVELTHIYVKPLHRGKGLGTRLVALAKERAGDARLPIRLITEPQCREFFATRGFAETKHEEIDLTKWAPPYCGFGPFRLASMASEES